MNRATRYAERRGRLGGTEWTAASNQSEPLGSIECDRRCKVPSGSAIKGRTDVGHQFVEFFDCVSHKNTWRIAVKAASEFRG
jgi:hypothetical protein